MRGIEEDDLSHYLELESVLRGIALILDQSFGLRMLPCPSAEGELWHPSVRKMLLSVRWQGRDDEPVGILYLDLFQRAGKRGHAALYTLRVGMKDQQGQGGQSASADSPELMLQLPAAGAGGSDDEGRHVLRACVRLHIVSPPRIRTFWNHVTITTHTG